MKIAISEMFQSIQGEGKYVGHPAFFIRLGGCNLKCDFCDTKYHNNYIKMNISEIIDVIETKCKSKIIVITGGEPLLQQKQLIDLFIILKDKGYDIHLETNGSIKMNIQLVSLLDNVSISPKNNELNIVNENIDLLKLLNVNFNIKLIYPDTIHLYTELNDININYYIQPNTNEDIDIEHVINIAIELDIPISPRLHVLYDIK